MSSRTYTIVFEKNGTPYKMCKILYGSDGSYYVTSPYHTGKSVALSIMTVNYNKMEMEVPFSQVIELGNADDDDRRLKLSHHPSGLVQFSGEGLASGLDDAGNVRGIGVRSWPLDRPVKGPVFGIQVRDIESFQKAEKVRDACVFRDQDVIAALGADLLILEGYYFAEDMRRFIRRQADGHLWLSVGHPNGAVLSLRVLLPPDKLARQGFLAIELYAAKADADWGARVFHMSGSTGNLRLSGKGDTLADGIFCVYPADGIPSRRSFNYPPPPATGVET